METKWLRIVVPVFLCVSLLTPGAVLAGVDDLIKQADTIVRNAERKMHSGKNEEAAAMLQEAASLLEQAKGEEPSNTKISQTESKLDRIQKSVDKKLVKTSAAPVATGVIPPETPQSGSMPLPSSAPSSPSAGKSVGDTLPGGVKKRLKDITRHLDSAEDYAGSDAEKAKYKLGGAAELFEEIDKMYGDTFDPAHPDYAEVKNRYNALTDKAAEQGAAEAKAEADAAGAKDAKEKQSAEWVAKFQEYLAYSGSEGHNPAKLVIVPGTSEPEKFADAKKRYDAFKKFYEEYRKTEFPNGRTWALEDLADNQAPLRIQQFEKEFAGKQGSVSERAEGEINAAMAQLEKDNGWKSDKSIRPNLVDHKWMSSIKEATEEAVSALGADAPKGKEVQAKFDALVAKDKENRQIRKERTFMISDRYTGNDIRDLKKKAEDLVRNNAVEGGTPLRSTIIAENWREETVHEWTDTSRTVRRWRTTRHQTAQVAAKTSDGCRLVTVALAQDKQSDGQWGPLYGNLHQGFDPMLEENVTKEKP